MIPNNFYPTGGKYVYYNALLYDKNYNGVNFTPIFTDIFSNKESMDDMKGY